MFPFILLNQLIFLMLGPFFRCEQYNWTFVTKMKSFQQLIHTFKMHLLGFSLHLINLGIAHKNGHSDRQQISRQANVFDKILISFFVVVHFDLSLRLSIRVCTHFQLYYRTFEIILYALLLCYF